MNIEVLGALNVRENGVCVTPTAPKPRRVLALLALHADQVVSVATLTDELWGSTPPRSAKTTLQTYVLQLRDLIGGALEQGRAADGRARTAKDVLVTVQGGYLLLSGGGTSDVREFERLTALGYEAMAIGDFQGAARQLRQALDLWSGPAFADVQAGAQLRTEARRLEESRLCALDRRIEADLRLGRHRDLLAELTVLVGRYPTHETLRGQYMLALHGSGRRSEALETYQNLRATLVRELGLEPSADLRRIQRQILAAATEEALDDTVDDDGGRPVPTS
ncbi:AfsR/SARP family transcriptional regulator [Streptomyces actinomycinicus]|uniref:AfsR/SARP family transcriptional regulator n=1 Tax=Streptomyces actinomycinicus TaxID=1695166 RepID=A0A937EQG6_9ACTN|nr:AfsR/SARP family transcriptional regulator [Streptomyces actinomycinicus]MBL1087693.1 AfsR/SARP family transcriptional regulator [Streptomyces actinomycinicus]